MTNGNSNDSSSKKIAAGICGILLGCFGVHKFILGYTTEGLIMLIGGIVGGLITCGVGSIVMGVIGLAEGIIYLTKSDQEFEDIYINNSKGWF